MADMKPTKRRGGTQYMHRETEEYRQAIRRKLNAYRVFLFMGAVTHGLMHYFTACHAEPVWRCFRSWLRTIRTDVVPSEMVVTLALRNELPDFQLVGAQTHPIAKFIGEHQARGYPHYFGKAA